MDRTAAFRFGRFEWRPARRQLTADGEPVPLGSRAIDLLQALIERRDRTVSKDELLDLVWPDVIVEEANLPVHVSALREMGYQGYLSAEVFPQPDPITAARQTIAAFREHVLSR